MPPTTTTSPHPTTPLIPGFYWILFPTAIFSQNIPETQNVTETQNVPQTQPTSSKGGRSRRHRRKGENEVHAPKTIERWTHTEELALSQAWLDVSEDPIVIFLSINFL
ncbi:hypothetical protein Hanom_Chr15g01392261 [Helianthus anomalus]